MNYCSQCKKTDVPLIKYSKPKQIQYYMCRNCNNLRAKKYYKTPKGKIAYRKSYLKSCNKYPEKLKARGLLNKNILLRKLFKPGFCEVCKRSDRIEGHHFDYTKPLDVIWLCSSCHSDYHKVK